MLTLMTVMFLMFAGQDNVLHRAPLNYPRAAMLKGIEGSVLVEDAVENILRNPLVRDIYLGKQAA